MPPTTLDKVRLLLTFLENASTRDALWTAPLWKVHQLTGNRKGTYALSVTGKWRITFKVRNNELIEGEF